MERVKEGAHSQTLAAERAVERVLDMETETAREREMDAH